MNMLSENRKNEDSMHMTTNDLISCPFETDSKIWDFLADNHFLIHNDKGHIAINELIDDNHELFQASFAQTICKSVNLIFKTTDSGRLSTRKKRLRDQLLENFQNVQPFTLYLTKDYILFLKIYTTFFKYRIKLYQKKHNGFATQIFGDKSAESHVKVLYDSSMFYILEKQPRDETLHFYGPNEKSLSKIISQILSKLRISRNSTIANLREELSGFKETIILKRTLLGSQKDEPEECSYSIGDIVFGFNHNGLHKSMRVTLDDTKGIAGTHIEADMELQKNNNEADEANREMVWRSIFQALDRSKSIDQDESNKPCFDTSDEKFCYGILTSYSVSGFCGFIKSFTEQQIIVVREELEKAGLRCDLISTSIDNIGANVQFVKNNISSESTEISEAIDVIFIKQLSINA